MGGKARTGGNAFRLTDFLVILLCLSGAAASFNLFRLDLFQTISSRNEKPVGYIILKHNTVQRRMSDRVLWDRLAVQSPVYLGDMIRVAELSGATLHIDTNLIELEENTLIRIQRARDGEGIRIELNQGTIGLATEDSPMTLDLADHQMQAGPRTTFTAAAGAGGMELRVFEGVVFVEETQIPAGTMLALDPEGAERREPSVAATLPRPNARYLKSRPEPLPVAFAWNRFNLEPGDALRLEIASDRNFTRVIRIIEGLNNEAQAALEAGFWYWRLSFRGAVLSTGRFSVVAAAGPALLNPAMDRSFYIQEPTANLRFEWSEITEASHYNLEVCETQDFINPRIRRQVDAAFFADSSLEPGTWYWRVMPVFSSVYEGSSAFSPASLFHIRQDEPEETVSWIPPEPPVPVPVIPPEIRLISPADGAALSGLTALRQQTVFRWDTDGETVKSRFILSRNPDPFRGRPETEIPNPGRTINLELGEGLWYWTVETEDPEGLVSAAAPLRLEVLPIPLLPAPGGRLPANRSRIGIAELQSRQNIVFRWAAVQGANAYIFTLYQQTASGRRQIIRRPAENRTSWTLDDLSALDRGTFVWQVEAVNQGRNNAIEQRGRIEENTFVIDFPLPGPVRIIEDTGIFYGN
jgi:hypothetical protein